MNIMRHIVWALFENDEDGWYGSGTSYNPLSIETIPYAIGWWFRNPFHNFTHHVIGLYKKDFKTNIIRNPGKGLNILIHTYKGFKFPYYNYIGNTFQFYFGWRTSGAFGIAFRKING